MVVMYRMSAEKRDKMIHKLDKMMDFLEEYKTCLEEASEEEEYRGGSYRKDKEWDEEESYRGGRYRYRR
jgi:hypothetical protein